MRKWFLTQWRAHRSQLRFCVRVTVAAILALLIAQFFTLPLHGLWVVLTATVVSQMSVGGSVRASVEYVVGTFGGAAYAGLIGLLIPHNAVASQAGVLAITIAPLAFAAALNANFRVAPFSAVLVLLISAQLGEGPIESAVIRLLEVALGGAVAVIVSLLVIPVSADRLVREAAAAALNEMANDVSAILAGLFQSVDRIEIAAMQNRIGSRVTALQDAVAEMESERPVTFTAVPDPGPLPRTLLRLRHDIVIMGRACAEQLPPQLGEEIRPRVDGVAETVSNYLRGCGRALTARRAAPPLDPVQAVLGAFTSDLAARRHDDLAQMSAGQLETIFALGFAFDQLQRDVTDLARCVRDWAAAPKRARLREEVTPP